MRYPARVSFESAAQVNVCVLKSLVCAMEGFNFYITYGRDASSRGGNVAVAGTLLYLGREEGRGDVPLPILDMHKALRANVSMQTPTLN